ncbi:MAG: hypothetical protein H6818_05080 [Phycisphaerales bacterium]|nr:hypothetical protein [Phycisphaerales bacterium]MCB9863442.1 hypothetical protein [Phycisphaerales bacterium]
MTQGHVDRSLLRIVEDAERTLNRWKYAVAENGGLWIRPSGPRLNTKELGGFLRLLTDVFAEDPPTEIVFNMSAVKYLGPNWTLALALFIDFAQRLNVPCHIDGIHGQPAAVANLYNRSPQVRALVNSACDGALLESARQSA